MKAAIGSARGNGRTWPLGVVLTIGFAYLLYLWGPSTSGNGLHHSVTKLATALPARTTEARDSTAGRARDEIEARLKQLLRNSTESPASVIFEFCKEINLDTIDDYLGLRNSTGFENFGYDVPARIDFAIHLRWLELDSDSAVQDAISTWSPDAKAEMLPRLFSRWSQIDPAAAIEYYRSVRQDQSLDDRSLIALLSGEATRDFNFFCRELATFPRSETRTAALRKVIFDMLDNGSAAEVMRALSTATDPTFSDEATAYLYVQWARRAPAALSAFAPILETPGAAARGPAGAIFTQWLEVSPEQATAWLDRASSQLVAGDLQIYYRTFLNLLPVKDLTATEEWISHQPHDGRLDLALAELALRIRSRDPARAARWVGLIQNSDARRRAGETLARETRIAENPRPTADDG